MSVLTKVFVVLHVVLSLVLTSGIIVFVNRAEPAEKKAQAAKEAEGRERSGRLAAEQELAALSGSLNVRVVEADNRAEALKTAMDMAEAKAKEAEAAKGVAVAAREKAEAERATADTAAQGAVTITGNQQKAITETAAKLAEAQTKLAEAETRVAALDKELTGTRYVARRLREDNTALTQKLDDLGNRAAQPGGGAGAQGGAQGGNAAAGGGAGGIEAAMNLRGVVKAKRNINGTEYATISLGSAQRVQKGMEFKVIEGGNFLGYLTVDSVESDESVGHLTGPSLDQVRKGSEVRTQW